MLGHMNLDKPPVMVSVNYQIDQIQGFEGDRPLGILVGDFLDYVS